MAALSLPVLLIGLLLGKSDWATKLCAKDKKMIPFTQLQQNHTPAFTCPISHRTFALRSTMRLNRTRGAQSRLTYSLSSSIYSF